MIHISVKKHTLTATTDEELVAKCVGAVLFDAEFDKSWNGYLRKIVFAGAGGEVPVIYTGGVMEVPWQAMDKYGLFQISAVGLAEGKRKVTVKMEQPMYLHLNGALGDNSPDSEPVLSLTEQAIQKCEKSAAEAKNAATQAAKEAEAAGEIVEIVKPDITRLYTALISDTLAGPLVQETFVADTPLDYQINIEAEQAGKGEPSPENVRPVISIRSVNLTIGCEDAETNPDNRTTHNIALPDTSYGGYIDYKRGKYVKTHDIKVFNGTEAFTVYNAQKNVFYTMDIPDAKYDNGCRCLSNYFAGRISGPGHSVETENSVWLQHEVLYKRLYIRCSLFTSTHDVNTWLAEQFAAGTPLTVVYPLANPVEYDLIILPQLTAREGKTTVYSDAASVTVTGYLDTKAYIDKKVADLIAPNLQEQ